VELRRLSASGRTLWLVLSFDRTTDATDRPLSDDDSGGIPGGVTRWDEGWEGSEGVREGEGERVLERCEAWLVRDKGSRIPCERDAEHPGDHVALWVQERWTNGHSAVTEYGPEEPKNLRLEL